MRIAALVAMTLLVAGCSDTGTGSSRQTPTTPSGPSGPSVSNPSASASSASSSAATASPGSTPPGAGAPIAGVISWIEAGHPADPGHFHRATREGVVTELGADIAFSVPGGKANCMTDTKHTGGNLICLVDLTSPPPRPETAYGEWKGGWVAFDGTTLEVGAARGDPGPFVAGTGPELAGGETLSFDDYRCRADQTGLYCVNYAHQSAARFSAAGIEPFGCLRPVPPPDGVGLAFGC